MRPQGYNFLAHVDDLGEDFVLFIKEVNPRDPQQNSWSDHQNSSDEGSFSSDTTEEPSEP